MGRNCHVINAGQPVLQMHTPAHANAAAFSGVKPCKVWGHSGPTPAYNAGMNQTKVLGSRFVVFAALCAATGVCAAQTAPAPAQAASAAPASRGDQVIQRIRTEDAGSRIDEVRVGGQTQSITVQPKTGTNIPAYEVKPSDTANGAAPSTSKGDTTGSRVWNVLKF